VFRSYFRGLKWLIIRFIALFLLLCVVLLVLSIFAEFKFTSLNHKIKRCFEAMWIKEDSKKRPKMTKHKQSTQTRTSTKCSVREAGEREGKSPRRPDRGVHHGPWWLTHSHAIRHAWSCIPVPSALSIPLRLFGFLCDFFDFGCCFVSKRAYI